MNGFIHFRAARWCIPDSTSHFRNVRRNFHDKASNAAIFGARIPQTVGLSVDGALAFHWLTRDLYLDLQQPKFISISSVFRRKWRIRTEAKSRSLWLMIRKKNMKILCEKESGLSDFKSHRGDFSGLVTWFEWLDLSESHRRDLSRVFNV